MGDIWPKHGFFSPILATNGVLSHFLHDFDRLNILCNFFNCFLGFSRLILCTLYESDPKIWILASRGQVGGYNFCGPFLRP